MPMFSIVIPFYNTEPEFYKSSFSSLSSLSEELVEILVIDDGSDITSALELERDVSELLPNATVIHKENGGQNSARQYGVNVAKGEYVIFLDSDDYLDVSALLELADYLRCNSPSVIAFSYDVVSPNGTQLDIVNPWVSGFSSISLPRLLLNSGSLWRQCYRLHSLNRIPFDLVQGVKIGEDLASSLSLNLVLPDRISFGRVLYHYVQRPSSIIQNPPREAIYDIYDAFDEVIYRCGPDYSGCRAEIEWMAILHCLYWGSRRIVSNFGTNLKLKSSVFSWINSRFPDWRNNIYLQSEPVAKTFQFILLTRGLWRCYSILHHAKHYLAQRRT